MNLLEKKKKKSKLNFVLKTKFQAILTVFVMGKKHQSVTRTLWRLLLGKKDHCDQV